MSPISKPINPGVGGAGMNPAAAGVGLPLRFVLTAIAALFVGACWLAFRPELLASYHYTQYTVAVTHVFTLGWITTIIMGAMYQLVPVALETTLFSERLGRWQFVFHVTGVVGMIWSFWIWDMKYVGHFASLVALGMVLFAYNLGRTLARVSRWNIIATAITAALFWMIMTLLAGLYLTADKCWNLGYFPVMAQIHAHAHLAVIGFFLTLLLGVSYKLVPMFTLSDIQNPRRAAWALGLLNAGLVATAWGILRQNNWRLAGGIFISAALVTYAIEMRAILQRRKRRQLDWGLRYFFTAELLLAPLSILGLILAWPGLPATLLTTQLESVYGYLALMGVLTLAILGMSYKILPFLVWYKSYSPLVGRNRVPALGEMYSTRLQAVGYFSYLLGLGAVCIAIAAGNERAVQSGGLLVVLSLAVYGINLGLILRHFWKPRVQPLIFQPSSRIGTLAVQDL